MTVNAKKLGISNNNYNLRTRKVNIKKANIEFTTLKV